MQITIEYAHTVMEVPKGCRKSRTVSKVGDYTVTIPESTRAKAPVAIITRSRTDDDNPSKEVHYRWANEKLWLPFKASRVVSASLPALDSDLAFTLPDRLIAYCDAADPYNCNSSLVDTGLYLKSGLNERDVLVAIDAWSSDCLIIDGVFHRVVGEPRYAVLTFGLGNDHEGTSVVVHDWYNANISHTRYFSALHLAAAQEVATAVGFARGDRKKIWLNPSTSIEVLIPEAIKVDPALQHGDGDPIINKMEKVITDCRDIPLLALAMLHTNH